MIDVPDDITDDEILHRRIHPTFRHPDGRISSQAFNGPEMSVDRALYRTPEESLLNHRGFGLAGLSTASARGLSQQVRAAKELLNPAHALVIGHKSKTTARKLAEAASWVVQIGEVSMGHQMAVPSSLIVSDPSAENEQ